MKKILIFSNNYYPYYDGISVYTNNLYSQLEKSGYEVKIINFDNEFTKVNFKFIDLFYSRYTFNKYNAPHIILNPKLLFNNNIGFRYFVFSNMISRIAHDAIRKYNPDIIHITYARLFPLMHGVDFPIIVTAHAEEIKDNDGVRKYFEKAQQILCISEYSKQLVCKINKAFNSKITVIPNSIDIEKFKNLNDINKQNYIVSVARLSKEKNLENTIKAFSKLPVNIKNKYTYYIIGSGIQKYILQQLITKLNLNKSVKLTGNLSESEKISLLKNSQIFLLCPKIKKDEAEGFGIAFLEAQAAELPIITSNIGGIKEAVGNAGIYISDPEDSDLIASKLLNLIENNKLQKELIANSHKRIHKYDHSKWIKQIIKVYNLFIK